MSDVFEVASDQLTLRELTATDAPITALEALTDPATFGPLAGEVEQIDRIADDLVEVVGAAAFYWVYVEESAGVGSVGALAHFDAHQGEHGARKRYEVWPFR